MNNNSSTIYFPNKEIYCKLYIYNFLFRNYNYENIILNVDFYSLKGKLLKHKEYYLKDDESIILDSKNCEFNEDIVIELSLQNNLGIKGIIRAFADYYKDDLITCVHEQGAFWDSNNDIVAQGNINLLNKIGLTSYALIHNTHFEKKEISFNIRVYNHKGESLLISGKKLKYKEFCKFPIQVDEKLSKFLDNEDGHYVIEFSNYIGRASYLQADIKNNFISISHATYYAFKKREHTSRDYYIGDKETINGFLFFNNYNYFSTKIKLFNDYKETKFYDVEIYDENGELIDKKIKIVALHTNQTATISGDVLTLKDNFKGFVKIYTYFENNLNPLYENCNYIMEYKNFMADSAVEFIPKLNKKNNDISKFANEKSILSSTSFRSRQFIRGIVNEKYTSYLIVNFTAIKEQFNTKTKISFISKDGNISITKYIEFKVNTPFFENLENILNKKELEMLGEEFSIYLRDIKNKVVSFILIQNRISGDIGMDHFVGA